jgi:murein L,D-transpeptidase YcbB/YkuD
MAAAAGSAQAAQFRRSDPAQPAAPSAARPSSPIRSRACPPIQDDVRIFYEMNGWKSVWTPAQMQALNAVAASPRTTACPPADFFDFVGLAADPASMDVRTTAAVHAYARVLAEGRVRPEDVEDLWEMQKNRVDLPTGLNAALAQSQLVDWFDGLPPPTSAIPTCRTAICAIAA